MPLRVIAAVPHSFRLLALPSGPTKVLETAPGARQIVIIRPAHDGSAEH
jgi:hypothetical protein